MTPAWLPSMEHPFGVRRPAINQAMRREVAERYGCGAGETLRISCAYCPSVIFIDRTHPRRTRFLDANGMARPELDHVIPLARGGPHESSNLVPACLSCNRSKCARLLAGGGD